MSPFTYVKATDPGGAVRAFRPDAQYLAGGTNLLDLMKEGVARPGSLVDLTRLALTHIGPADDDPQSGALSIGALARNSDTANHPLVKRRFPLLSQAILAGASAQIRNMATTGGNLNQRTRCPYFYEPALACNKRSPGSGCSAREGVNRSHAIFGWTDGCVATHPSDMCVALAALDASVNVLDTDGEPRTMAFVDYHRLPGEDPQRDNRLKPGEIVTSVVVPANNLAGRSCYLKVRERTSYAFALVSVAAALEVSRGIVVDVRLAMGGVAHKPWRAVEAERVLLGQPPSGERFAAAAAAAMEAAKPLPHNRYKVELGRRLIARALQTALVGANT